MILRIEGGQFGELTDGIGSVVTALAHLPYRTDLVTALITDSIDDVLFPLNKRLQNNDFIF